MSDQDNQHQDDKHRSLGLSSEKIAAATGFIALVASLLLANRAQATAALALLAIALISLGYSLIKGVKQKRSFAIFLDELSWGGTLLVSIPLFLLSAFIAGIILAITGFPIDQAGSGITKVLGLVISFSLVAAFWISISRAAANKRDRLYPDRGPINPTQEINFTAATKDGLVLVDFWAEWCDPCKEQAAILHEYQNDRLKIISVDIDKEPGLAERFAVESLPTIMLFSDGNPVERNIGLTKAKQIDLMIAKHQAAVKADTA